MKSKPKARITGLGAYLPKTILSNKDLEKIVETSDEWIVSRTGMKERRIAAADEYPSDMGAHATMHALQQAGLAPKDVDAIIVATMTPDYISPSTAALIQAKIGASQAMAVDIQAACSGYLYLLSMAKAYVESGLYKNVVVIASEKMSSFIDYKDRNTCVLFGDGATAAVIQENGQGFAINSIHLGADGNDFSLIQIPGGGSRHPCSKEMMEKGLQYFKMSGKEVFKQAIRRMASAAKECLTLAGLQEQQMSWIIPHQANIRILEGLGKQFNIPEDRVYKTIHKYGNTSGSSVGIALEELARIHPLRIGEHILLLAFGGGLTWGASVITKVDA